jgi:type IV secretory pathway VirB10-like protein
MNARFAVGALSALLLLAGANGALAATATCKEQAAEKKYAGIVLTNFMKKCEAEAKTACEKSAAEKKPPLAGAPKTAFVKKCVDDAVGATAAAPPPPPPAATAPPPPPPPPAAAPKPTPAPKQPTAAAPNGEFATEALAKAHCPADVVVWANLDSKIFHYAGYKEYGKTKKGAYMCEKEAVTAGIRAAKDEKRP